MTYNYIQVSRILMYPYLQRWRRQSHWLDLHLFKANIFQPESNKHRTKTKIKNTPHKTENRNKQSCANTTKSQKQMEGN